MYIFPIIYMGTLTDEELVEHECSDRIWLHTSDFEKTMGESEPGLLQLFQLTNRVDQSIVGSVHGIHSGEPDTVYVPNWMFQCLDLDDNVELTPFQPSLCTRITIQPHTSDHLHADDPQELLRDAFERYACITMGATIPLWIGLPLPFTVTITDVNPNTNNTLCIRNCEIELELLRPLDMPEEVVEAEVETAEKAVEAEKAEKAVAPGIILGGAKSTKSRRELLAEAAANRIHKN